MSRDQQLSVVFYTDEVNPAATPIQMTWGELVETLTEDRAAPCSIASCAGKTCPHKSCSRDDALGAWSPIHLTFGQHPRHPEWGEGHWRRNERVEHVDALVLDGDGLTDAQLASVSQALQGGSYIAHTTHRHRDGVAFIRVVVQLSRAVVATEWPIFRARAVEALELGEIFDPTCKDLARLYFLPTHPSDAPFLTQVGEGEPIDVDAILSRSPSSERTPVVTPEKATEADHPPLEVEDGATNDRFTSIGDLVARLKIYHRSRAHRATEADRDKAGLVGRLLEGKPLAAPGGNAEPSPIEPPADLPKGRGHAIMRTARILTGYLPVTTPDEVYLAMFAKTLDAMCFGRAADRPEMEEHLLEKIRIGREQRRQFEEEMNARNTASRSYRQALMDERAKNKQRAVDEEATASPSVATEASQSSEESEDSWMSELRQTKDGSGILSAPINAYLILKNADVFRGAFRWNEVTLQIDTFGVFANVEREVLDVAVANYLARHWGYDGGFETILRQIYAIAFENRYDPLKDYLRALEWDGVDRVSADGGWLKRYANVDVDGEEEWRPRMIESVGRKWLIGCVARALNPGCKNDCVLIVEGEQGTWKSSLFEVLGGEYFADMALAIGDKDSKMIAARSWICEIPDLAALKKAGEVNAIKAFFSTRVDTFRPPFGKAVISSPRRNAFGGTTNEEQYLSDSTGNRRFLCVKSTGEVDLESVKRDRDQLWAQSVVMYMHHVNKCENKLKCGCWWFRDEEAKRINDIAEERVQENAYEPAIMEWWSGLEPEKRERHVKTFDVAKEAMQLTPDRIQKWLLMEIGSSLQKLGWKRTQTHKHGKHIRVYAATDELMELPQSEAGKKKMMKFKPALRAV